MDTDMDSETPKRETTKGFMRKEHNEQIRADRACIGCGFNLFGQPVQREEHYNLAITRCPECGEVAAIQSYPVMSHWVNRFRAILGASWIVTLFIALAINSLILMGLIFGGIELAGDQLGEQIGISHSQWAAKQAQVALDMELAAKKTKDEESTESNERTDSEDTTNSTTPAVQGSTGVISTTIDGVTTTVYTSADGSTSTTINGVAAAPLYSGSYQWSTITPIWIDRELDNAIKDMGGVWANIDRNFMIMFLPVGFVSLISGVFWSVVLLGAKRRTVIWVPVLVSIMALILVFSIQSGNGSMIWANDVATELVTIWITPIMIGCGLLFGMIGVFFGRSFARIFVLVSLPPRNRTSLSILWTRDGLELPKPNYPNRCRG